jgi:hypothetical protein
MLILVLKFDVPSNGESGERFVFGRGGRVKVKWLLCLMNFFFNRVAEPAEIATETDDCIARAEEQGGQNDDQRECLHGPGRVQMEGSGQ